MLPSTLHGVLVALLALFATNCCAVMDVPLNDEPQYVDVRLILRDIANPEKEIGTQDMTYSKSGLIPSLLGICSQMNNFFSSYICPPLWKLFSVHDFDKCAIPPPRGIRRKRRVSKLQLTSDNKIPSELLINHTNTCEDGKQAWFAVDPLGKMFEVCDVIERVTGFDFCIRSGSSLSQKSSKTLKPKQKSQRGHFSVGYRILKRIARRSRLDLGSDATSCRAYCLLLLVVGLVSYLTALRLSSKLKYPICSVISFRAA